jgi:hypothetical protein
VNNPKCSKCGHRKSTHSSDFCYQCYNFTKRHQFTPLVAGEHHRSCPSRTCRICGLGPRKGHSNSQTWDSGGRSDHFMERGECDCA